MSLSDFWAEGELPFDKWSQIWPGLHTTHRSGIIQTGREERAIFMLTWKILSIINIYDQSISHSLTHRRTPDIAGDQSQLISRSEREIGETESLRAEKMTRKEIMSEECAVRPSFNMCEILLTPGKDFIIQASQPRLVGIMGAILAFRDKLVWRGRGERGLVRGSHKMRSVRCKIYCHIMTNS